MKVGIVGGRLAGSYAALILASRGHQVRLFDPSTGGEKACGGGITAKALGTLPWLREQKLPCNEIREVELTTLEGCSTLLLLKHPIHIFSRAVLDTALRTAAIDAGARFHPERVLRFEPLGEGWALTTSSGARHGADFLIGADGASSSVRAAVSNKFAAEDLSLALGHYLPGTHHPDRIVIVFQECGFPGYLWSFPRVDHASVGIIHRLQGVRAADLRRRVAGFISERYPTADTSGCGFFAARVPCLRRSTLAAQRVCGRNWALVGDAAGFVDPITAEGIYFALRSAKLLGEALGERDPLSYEQRWRRDFGADLERAAEWRHRFYNGLFILRPFIRRAIQMLGVSATTRRITDALICGRLTYQQMRSTLLSHSPRILMEAVRGALFRSG